MRENSDSRAIDDLTDALFKTSLIEGYDWLGTSSRYPTDEEIRSEVREMAIELMSALSDLEVTQPHSRACGVLKHNHGTSCNANCPTCGGE